MKRTSRMTSAWLVLLFSESADARTWYVKPDSTGDAPTIQAAMDSAQTGDEVLLAPGTYTWTSQGASGGSMVEMAARVVLRGETGPESTVLDAEARGRVILCNNVGIAGIEGITIANGLERTFGGGGGILSQGDSQPTISNCIIQNNEATNDDGGGIFCENAFIRDCRILDNVAGSVLSSDGGGIACRNTSIERCIVRGNRVSGVDGAGTGGGISLIGGTISDCWIEGNLAIRGLFGARGGGAAVSGTVRRCTFVGNQVGIGGYIRSGGGIICLGDCDISDCVFARNRVEAFCCAWKALGGAIAVGSSAHARITACTLVGNEAAHENTSSPPVAGVAGEGLAEIFSTIIAFNAGAPCWGNISMTCMDVFGNSTGDSLCSGRRSFSADPEFCSEGPATSLDFTLQQDSPCLPGNHPPHATSCGLIGAASVGCGTVSVRGTTWSRLKSLYR